MDDDEGENEEPQKRGDFLRTPPRRKQFPRTPIERSLSPRFRRSGHTYKPHQHAQPPPIPKSAMLERHSFAARRMIHTTRNVVERWLLRTAFTSWIRTIGSRVKPSTHPKKKVVFSLGSGKKRERNPWNTSYDYSKQFLSWKDAAMRIQGGGSEYDDD